MGGNKAKRSVQNQAVLVEVTGFEPVSVNATGKTTTSVVSGKISSKSYAETHGQGLVPSKSFEIGTYEPIPTLVDKIKRNRQWSTH